MNKTAGLFLLVALSVMLCGCPFDSHFSIDESPAVPVDESLIGKWATMVKKPGFDGLERQDPMKLIIEKASDMEYSIALTGRLTELKRFGLVQDDSIKARAFLSEIAGYRFLNIQINNRYYFAQVKEEGKKLSLLMLRQNFTPRFIKHPADLRNAILFHYKTVEEPFYDEWCNLINLQRVN